MNSEFIIRINKDKTGNSVSLENMNIDAVEALTTFLSSLSEFAKLHENSHEIKLSVKKGSIESTLTAPADHKIYSDIQDIVEGKSQNNDFIKLFKNIQDKIMSNGLDYSIYLNYNNNVQDLTTKFKTKKFPLKRKLRKSYCDVLFIEGYLFEAGGRNKTNVHIETIDRTTYTINCEKDEAKMLNERLYDKVYISVLRTYKDGIPYEYKLLDYYLKNETYGSYKEFFMTISQNKNLERFDIIHDRLVEIITNDNISNGEMLKIMRLYNYNDADRGIMRTILMTLKRVPKDDKLETMYHSLARHLREGNSKKMI